MGNYGQVCPHILPSSHKKVPDYNWRTVPVLLRKATLIADLTQGTVENNSLLVSSSAI